MQNNEPRPKSTGAAVADLLRDAILTREFVDGERLPELLLCEKYGVSRIPLREAFQILASEGLIVSTANKGARVRILGPRDIDQCISVCQGYTTFRASRTGVRELPEFSRFRRQPIIRCNAFCSARSYSNWAAAVKDRRTACKQESALPDYRWFWLPQASPEISLRLNPGR